MTSKSNARSQWLAHVDRVKARWVAERDRAVNLVYAVSWHYGSYRAGGDTVQVVPAGAVSPGHRWLSPKGSALVLSVGRDRRNRAVVRTDRGAWTVGLGCPVTLVW